MKKETLIQNEDDILKQNLGKIIHSVFGLFIKKMRLLSPLTHEELMECSTLNSGSIWVLEHHNNFELLTFMQAAYCYMKSLRCIIYPNRLCRQIISSLKKGKCLVVKVVDVSELSEYEEKYVILKQEACDEKEIGRRRNRHDTLLANNLKQQQGVQKKKEKQKTLQVSPKKKPRKKRKKENL